MVDQPTLNAGRGEEPGAGRGSFAAVVRRWRWMLAIAAVAAGCIGYVIASSSTPTYNATAQLLVGPINTSDTDVLQASGQLAQTYAQLATSRPVLAATSRRVGGVQDLEQSVSASANAVTRLLTLQVSSRDPRLGARIANAEAAVLIDIATQRGAGDGTTATPGTGSAGRTTSPQGTAATPTVGR